MKISGTITVEVDAVDVEQAKLEHPQFADKEDFIRIAAACCKPETKRMSNALEAVGFTAVHNAKTSYEADGKRYEVFDIQKLLGGHDEQA